MRWRYRHSWRAGRACAVRRSDAAHILCHPAYLRSLLRLAADVPAPEPIVHRLTLLEWLRRRNPLLLITAIHPFENKRCIDPTEAAGMSECDVNGTPACFVCHIIEIALGIGQLLIDCWRQHLLLYDKGSDDGFNCACCALRMSNHRFCSTYWDAIRLLPKDRFVGHCLSDLVGRGRAAMRIDIVKLSRCNVSLGERLPEQLLEGCAISGQGSHMIGVAV